MKLEIEMFTVN